VNVEPTGIPEVLVLRPAVHADDRGFFFESYNRLTFDEAVGAEPEFVQDNHSRSQRGVLRGLHYQLGDGQGKLVRVTVGEVFDVAVDVRARSPTCGRWVAVRLSAENKKQIWIPRGFAHGFYVLSDAAEVQYKTTTYYSPRDERTIAWNDEDIGVDWPFEGTPTLSDKDRGASKLRDAELFP
jgi:dTDP-4-dehydrorhamnose 3,5-epimerase